MKTPTIVALFLCMIMTTHARLFETMAECEKRYGKHIEESKDGLIVNRLYKLDGVVVFVAFAKGNGKKEYQARGILYSKPGTFGGLDAAFVRTLLKANSGGLTWTKVDYFKLAMNATGLEKEELLEEGAAKDTWIRSDKKVLAKRMKFEPSIVIHTDTYAKYMRKRNKKESKF